MPSRHRTAFNCVKMTRVAAWSGGVRRLKSFCSGPPAISPLTSLCTSFMSRDTCLYLDFVGAAAGFLAGLFGVGGGAVVVPLLALATDLDHKTALGTSLCAMVPTGVAGVLAHRRLGHVKLAAAAPTRVHGGANSVCNSVVSQIAPRGCVSSA